MTIFPLPLAAAGSSTLNLGVRGAGNCFHRMSVFYENAGTLQLVIRALERVSGGNAKL